MMWYLVQWWETLQLWAPPVAVWTAYLVLRVWWRHRRQNGDNPRLSRKSRSGRRWYDAA